MVVALAHCNDSGEEVMLAFQAACLIQWREFILPSFVLDVCACILYTVRYCVYVCVFAHVNCIQYGIVCVCVLCVINSTVLIILEVYIYHIFQHGQVRHAPGYFSRI